MTADTGENSGYNSIVSHWWILAPLSRGLSLPAISHFFPLIIDVTPSLAAQGSQRGPSYFNI
jgi:hypothetical protein